jgi:hypothetical protein
MTNIIAADVDVKTRMEALFSLYGAWPTKVPIPSTFEVKRSKWVLLNEGTPDEAPDYDNGPLAVVTLPNGAAVRIEQIDPYDQRSRYEVFSGDWDSYLNGNIDRRDRLSDILHDVFMRMTPKYDEKETVNGTEQD